MVIDFAKNYAHVSQNEPQSAHWDRRQTTMHPICINFRCTEDNCNELVTLEMVCFTEDLKHDSLAVKTFEDAAENYLRSIGIPVNVIFQWSDNCSNQYKSKYAFDIISTSATPKMRNYYGEKHGKSAADGIIGRLKMKIDQEIRSGTVTLDTTDDLYNYCINKLETAPTIGCQHYRRHYILIEEIPRPKRTAEPSRVMDTLKIHSVRSTGIPGVVEKQELSCMCDVCMEGGERCQNLHLVLGWSRVDLFSKSGKDFVNTHWPKVHNTRKERVKMSKRRRKKHTTAVNVNTSLRNKRKPPGKPNHDVTDKRSKRRRNKLTTAVNVSTSLQNRRKPPGKPNQDVTDKRSKRRRNKLTTAVNVNTSLQNKRKPPGKPNHDVTDKRSKRRRNKLTTAVNVSTSLQNRRKPPGKPNQDVTEEVKRRNTCHKKGNRKETTWIDVANDLEKSNSYQDLERRVQKVTLEPSIQMDKTSFPLGQNTVHDLTKELYPTYLPKGYDPINAYGDGNCLPRSISLIGYGNQKYFREIRAMLAVLGVRYKEFFLDNTFLNLGSNFDIDLAEYYAITSESYTIHARSGEWSREKIERIYETEVLNSTRRGNYCGMWQVYQAANILGRPIMSIFPHPGMIEEFRRRTNRMVYPIRIHKREREPVAVMWTKSRKDVHHEDHFVPIFKM